MKPTRRALQTSILALGLLTCATGYCFYNPGTGRWLSRDPISEAGGQNVYCFVHNALGVDRRGLAQLHYIDYPKWVQVNLESFENWFPWEFLWVGHYFSFNSSDVSGLSGGGGVQLIRHRSSAEITDCQAPYATVKPSSQDWYFENQFFLHPDGTVKSQDDPDAFTDGQIYLFTQIASWTLAGMFNRYGGTSGPRWTKGHIHSTMEFHFLPRDDFYDDGWDHSRPPGFDDTNINGHGLGRYYSGRMSDRVPDSWTTGSLFSTRIDMDFEWDDCGACNGGMTHWNYKINPLLAEIGQQRARYAGKKWPGINLISQPSN